MHNTTKEGDKISKEHHVHGSRTLNFNCMPLSFDSVVNRDAAGPTPSVAASDVSSSLMMFWWALMKRLSSLFPFGFSSVMTGSFNGVPSANRGSASGTRATPTATGRRNTAWLALPRFASCEQPHATAPRTTHG